MANVPYNPVPTVAPTGPSPELLHPETNPAQFGGLIGAAAQKTGGELEQGSAQVSQLAMQYAQQRNLSFANAGINKLTDVLTSSENQIHQLKGANAVNAAQTVQKNIEDQYNAILSSMPSTPARNQFMAESRFMITSTRRSIGLYVGNQNYEESIATQEGKMAAIGNLAALHYDDPVAVGHAIGQTAAAAKSLAQYRGITDPDAINAMMTNRVSNLLGAVLTAKARAGDTPEEQEKNLNEANTMFQQFKAGSLPGSPGVPMLDAAHQNAIGEMIEASQWRLQGRVEKEAAPLRVGIDQALSAATAIVGNGQDASAALAHISAPMIAAAYPNDPEMAAAVRERYHDLAAESVFANRIAHATPQQLELLKQHTPAPDPNDPATYRSRLAMSRALNGAITHAQKALATDPASYVLSSHPDIAALGTAAGKDPTQFPAYATAVLGAQAQMGVPEAARSVLPVPMATQMAQSVITDPASAPAKLQQMQQRYGAYWPKVWHDLVVRGKLPVAYEAVGTLQDEGQAALLARGLAEQGKSGKNLVDLLPPKAKTGANGIDTAIETSPEWQSLDTSLRQQPGMSPQKRDGILGAVKTLAYANMVYAGKTQADAVNAALKAFTEPYQFMPQVSGGARVPADKYDTVNANADTMLSTLDAKKVTVPPIYGKPGQPSVDDYFRTLKAGPTWVTSPNADSLWLMDNGGRIVRGANGTPLAVPFNAPLMTPEPTAPAIPAMGGL